MAVPSPDHARGWLGVAMPLLREGGPIVSLLLLVVGTLVVWWLLGALGRAQMTNRELVERLLAVQDAHRAELLRYVHCQREAP